MHAVGMQPSIGRIPNGMRRVVASLLSTERCIPTVCKKMEHRYILPSDAYGTPQKKRIEYHAYMIVSWFMVQPFAQLRHPRISDVIVIFHHLIDIAVRGQLNDAISYGLNKFMIVA